MAPLEVLDDYNRHKIHSAIGYATLDEFAKLWERSIRRRWQTDNEDKECAENVAKTDPKNRGSLQLQNTSKIGSNHVNAYDFGIYLVFKFWRAIVILCLLHDDWDYFLYLVDWEFGL